MAFQKAVKHDAKLRMSIAGPSGSGKTYTALTLATALADGQGVALIDTERGSASKYADIFSFDVLELDNFHPDKFVAGIHEAQNAGYSVLVIDSLTHAWNGTGGLLDLVDAIATRKYHGNSFAAWKDATPIQNALIDAITATPMHVIVTMRSKQEYALEVGSNGKSSPKKMGMAPIQRDGMEYEFDVAVDMDIDNNMIVQKSRCSALSGQIIAKPDKKVVATLKTWLSGVPKPEPPKVQASQSTNDGVTVPIDTSKKVGLADIPSATSLMTTAEALGLSWSETLNKTFKKGIEAGKIKLSDLLNKGSELPPDYCKIVNRWLEEYAAEPVSLAS